MQPNHLFVWGMFCTFLLGILVGLSFKDKSFKISDCIISPAKYSMVPNITTGTISAYSSGLMMVNPPKPDDKAELGYNVRCY